MHLYHQIHIFIIKSANMLCNTHCSTVLQACKRTSTTLCLCLLKLPVLNVLDNDKNSTDDEKEEEKKKKKKIQSEDSQFL
ncbi:hypothetical protein I7I50_11141 [Histoplasma capsulatum G186AR]|uniref:Uncharacterized protein n=1 Tax=Ajellomyces capsulatus TaxID=5037 RepID=A0A8H8D920_AJECA|nr:hypothetical protein I7I52_02380 [Histoplasma capsulatum]QSS69741.1 hypothetical protein I7I50_11141 [Histoplasma capsulatum G186AR]